MVLRFPQSNINFSAFTNDLLTFSVELPTTKNSRLFKF